MEEYMPRAKRNIRACLVGVVPGQSIEISKNDYHEIAEEIRPYSISLFAHKKRNKLPVLLGSGTCVTLK